MEPIQQTTKEKIQKAFEEKRWGDVIMLTENEVITPTYEALTKEYGVADRRDIPTEKIFAYFADHEFAPLLLMKGTAALGSGDPMLAGRMFADACLSSHNGTVLATAYVISAILRLGMADNVAGAHDDLVEAKKHDPQVTARFDVIYGTYLNPDGHGVFPAQKEEIKKQLDLL